MHWGHSYAHLKFDGCMTQNVVCFCFWQTTLRKPFHWFINQSGLKVEALPNGLKGCEHKWIKGMWTRAHITLSVPLIWINGKGRGHFCSNTYVAIFSHLLWTILVRFSVLGYSLRLLWQPRARALGWDARYFHGQQEKKSGLTQESVYHWLPG